MKNSHFVTPRTMEDCQFDFDADPIEVYVSNKDRQLTFNVDSTKVSSKDRADKFVTWFSIAVIIGLIVAVYLELI